jgi:hypothetical protein
MPPYRGMVGMWLPVVVNQFVSPKGLELQENALSSTVLPGYYIALFLALPGVRLLCQVFPKTVGTRNGEHVVVYVAIRVSGVANGFRPRGCSRRV